MGIQEPEEVNDTHVHDKSDNRSLPMKIIEWTAVVGVALVVIMVALFVIRVSWFLWR